MPMMLEIITPDRTVVREPVDFVRIRGIEGDLGILPGHIPLFTPVDIDILEFRKDSEEGVVAVMGGFMEVTRDRVTILSDSAERSGEIDVLRAKAAKERAEVQLAKVKDFLAESALKRAITRLQAAEKQ